MYLKLTNGKPETYSIGQFRRDNPNVSFPKNPSYSLLAEWGVYPYTRPEPGEYDFLAWKLVDDDFVQVDGAWSRGYKLEALPLEEASSRVRSRRNNLLSDCDWTQVADAPVDQAVWAVYRQALRDISSQEGFPYNVVWPTQPE